MSIRLSLTATLCAQLIVSACVTISPPEIPKGRYTNYREMAYSRAQMLSWKGLPDTLQNQLRTCAVDAIWPYYTTEELQRLDAYARGENQLTTDEFNRLDAAVSERMGGKAGAKTALMATCPDAMKAAYGYGANPGN